jgi:organic hydroperoxide reductase OsmC/OhrA
LELREHQGAEQAMSASEKKIEFKAELSWDGKTGGEIIVGKGFKLHVDTPKEFGGEGKNPCPDEFFFSAIGGCLLTTFLYMKKKLEFNLKDLRIVVVGDVQSRGPEGFRVAGARVNLSVETDAEGEAQARKCIEMTEKFCHITQSLEKANPIRILSNVVVKKQ